MISIEIANQQNVLEIDQQRLKAALAAVLEDELIEDAQISLAVVDDEAIHELNRRYLRHDYATDVLSFVLERSEQRLEGQVIVSADMAVSNACRYGWEPGDELLLYVIHAALHLLGVDDGTPDGRLEMRGREGSILSRFGLQPHWEEAEE